MTRKIKEKHKNKKTDRSGVEFIKKNLLFLHEHENREHFLWKENCNRNIHEHT